MFKETSCTARKSTASAYVCILVVAVISLGRWPIFEFSTSQISLPKVKNPVRVTQKSCFWRSEVLGISGSYHSRNEATNKR